MDCVDERDADGEYGVQLTLTPPHCNALFTPISHGRSDDETGSVSLANFVNYFDERLVQVHITALHWLSRVAVWGGSVWIAPAGGFSAEGGREICLFYRGRRCGRGRERQCRRCCWDHTHHTQAKWS